MYGPPIKLSLTIFVRYGLMATTVEVPAQITAVHDMAISMALDPPVQIGATKPGVIASQTCLNLGEIDMALVR